MDNLDFFDEVQSDPVTLEHLDALCKQLSELKTEIEKVKLGLSELHGKESGLQRTIAEAIVSSGRTKFQSPYGTVSVSKRSSVAMPKEIESKKAFFEYLKENDLFDTMVTVNSNTLNSWYTSKITELEDQGIFGTLQVPGLPEPKQMEIIQFRKGKK